jgi:hypothetical protein
MPVGPVPSHAFLQVKYPLAFSPTQDDVLCLASCPSRLYIPYWRGQSSRKMVLSKANVKILTGFARAATVAACSDISGSPAIRTRSWPI